MIGVLKFQVLFLIFFSFWTEKLLTSQEKIWKYYKETVSKSKSLPRDEGTQELLRWQRFSEPLCCISLEIGYIGRPSSHF